MIDIFPHARHNLSSRTTNHYRRPSIHLCRPSIRQCVRLSATWFHKTLVVCWSASVAIFSIYSLFCFSFYNCCRYIESNKHLFYWFTCFACSRIIQLTNRRSDHRSDYRTVWQPDSLAVYGLCLTSIVVPTRRLVLVVDIYFEGIIFGSRRICDYFHYKILIKYSFLTQYWQFAVMISALNCSALDRCLIASLWVEVARGFYYNR